MSGGAPPEDGGRPVPSPCVSVCRLDESGLVCVGCGRTLDEIAAWSRMDDDDKRRVLARLDERRRAASGGS